MKLVKPIDLFQVVMKPMPKHRRLLGLDVGHKYVGVAVSDIKNRIASPLSVLVRKKTNIPLIADDLQRLSHQLAIVVLCLRDTIKDAKLCAMDIFLEEWITMKQVSELSLAGFVVGYAFSKAGHLDASRLQVEYFVKDLRGTGKLVGLNYTYWDEHYTSKCVESLLHPLDLHPVEAKTMSDKFAAVGILQGYLDAMQRNLKAEKASAK